MINSHKRDCYHIEPFAKARLMQALQFTGVKNVYPLYMDWMLMKNVKYKRTQSIIGLAFNLADPVLSVFETKKYTEALKLPDTMLFDHTSRRYCLGKIKPDDAVEVNNHKTGVVGTFTLFPNFMTDGHLIMSDLNFFKYFSGQEAIHRQDKVEYGIIKAEPGVDLNKLAHTMNQGLPNDVVILTKDEMIRQVIAHWKSIQPVVEIFGLGMIIGVIIGIMICYQILFTDISDHLAEFATLKAIGYPNRYLVLVVLQESLYLSLLGFLPGLLLSLGFYFILQNLTGILMHLTLSRLITVFSLTVVMCMFSAIFAVIKVLRTDAAEVF